MCSQDPLIPPPPIVRNRLARNIQERRLLRALLRLSVQAAEIRQSEKSAEASREEGGGGVVP